MSKQRNVLQKIKVMIAEGESVYYGHALRSKIKTEDFHLHCPQRKVGYDFKKIANSSNSELFFLLKNKVMGG